MQENPEGNAKDSNAQQRTNEAEVGSQKEDDDASKKGEKMQANPEANVTGKNKNTNAIPTKAERGRRKPAIILLIE